MWGVGLLQGQRVVMQGQEMNGIEIHDAKDTINKKKVFKNGLQEFSFKTYKVISL